MALASFPLTDEELSTAEALVADMRQRGKEPSDLNPRGQDLLRRLQQHVQSLGFSSFRDYEARGTTALSPLQTSAKPPATPDLGLTPAAPIQELRQAPPPRSLIARLGDYLRNPVRGAEGVADLLTGVPSIMRGAQDVAAAKAHYEALKQQSAANPGSISDTRLNAAYKSWLELENQWRNSTITTIGSLGLAPAFAEVGARILSPALRLISDRIAAGLVRRELGLVGVREAGPLVANVVEATRQLPAAARGLAGAPVRGLAPTRFPEHPAGQPLMLTPSPTAAIKPAKFGQPAQQVIEAAQGLPGEAAQRRGVLSDETVDEFAQMIGIRPDELARLSPGSVLSAEHVTAARQALKQSAERVYGAAQDVLRGVPEAQQAFEGLWRQHVVLQQRVAGVASESGRALRQFRRILQDVPTLPELDVAQARIGNVTAAAQRVLNAGKDQAAQALGDLAKPTWRDMLVEGATAAKVSGPLTQIRNTVGNTYAAMIRPVERTAAGAVDAMRSLITGAPRERFVGEAAADLFGKVTALRDASRNFVRALVDEAFTSQARAREIGRLGAIPGRTGRIVRLPFRWMAAVDEFFRELNRRGATYAEAYRVAAQRGLRGAALRDEVTVLAMNPTDAIASRAARDASEYLFQEELSDGMRTVMRYRNQSLLARLIVPFFRTPVNLVKFVAERSPIGAFLPRNVAALRAGGGEAADAIARVMVGSMLMAGLAIRASEGQITGAGPTNPKVRELLRAQGWQPYSVKIGGRWLSYRGFDPLAQFLANAANLVEVARDDQTYAAKAWELIQQAGRSVTEATWLQGLRDVLDAIDDPERYGQTFAARFAGGFIPRILSPITQAVDPTLREARTVAESVMAQLPGLSRRLPPRLDVLGRPIVREGGPLRGLAPSVSTPRDEPALAELARHEVGIPEPSRSVRRQGKTFAVPEVVRRRIIAERGRRVLEAVGRLVHSQQYRNLTDEQQRLALQRIVRDIAERTQPAYRELAPGR